MMEKIFYDLKGTICEGKKLFDLIC